MLDYGSGNVRSAVRALERAGAEVILSAKPEDVLNADGLVVPGVGAFETVMRELKAVDGIRVLLAKAQRLSSGKIGRRTFVNVNRVRLEDDRPGASTSMICRAIGSKAAR